MKRFFQLLSSLSAWVVQPLLILAILLVGFAAASRLSLRREPPQRAEAPTYAPLVRTVVATPRDHPVRVHGNGSLEARTRIDLVPQVGGEIVEIHPGLRSGGSFRAGEALLRIEPRDYELAVDRAEADVASAETGVVTVRAESESAVREWERLRPGEPCPPLVRLEPRIREAEAGVLRAQADLERAQLDLLRTELTLPFDGRVVTAAADVGEVVPAGQPLGVAYATDVFEVAVPLRVEELERLWLPAPARAEQASAEGSRAVVRGAGLGGPLEVSGRVARVFGELDSTSRQARVVVEVRASELDAEAAAGLLPGTFVDVELIGRTLSDVAEIPRGALREGGRVWTVVGDQLSFVYPEVRHRGDGVVLVEGLTAETRVVTSNLEVVTDGMRVRVQDEGDAR
ncbi:MAG: efflux RND transporter periplasmic adaptor subunit [Planctomycetota bacterium]